MRKIIEKVAVGFMCFAMVWMGTFGMISEYYKCIGDYTNMGYAMNTGAASIFIAILGAIIMAMNEILNDKIEERRSRIEP